ncbi:MAG: sulfite exporter TauE/SafE family protein [bacterium]
MSSNKFVSLPIKGMHCRSCELLVESELKELSNIETVKVDHATGEATIYYHGDKPSEKELERAIMKAGYEVGVENIKPYFNFDSDNLLELIIGSGLLFLLYIVLRGFGLTSLNFNPDTTEASYTLPLVVGLVAGVSTCMALVGGLVLGLSSKFAEKHPSAKRLESFRPHLFFVGGRIAGYALLGGILGMLGSVFQLSQFMNATLTILVGALMLFMGLQLINLFPRLSSFNLSLPISVAKFFGIDNKKREYSHKHAAMLGALTFFLPCGFTQTMQVFAVSRGNFIDGALIMGLFALGTAPGLLSLGGLTATVTGSFKKLFFKTVGIAIILLSLFNLNNGYTLFAAGLDFSGTSQDLRVPSSIDPNVKLEDGYQIVHMTETNTGYTPNKFTIQKGVPVKWIVDAQAPFSCASALGIPKLKLQKFLKAGENTIIFTANEVGPLKFSCSMGMYTGVFNVIDNVSQDSKNSTSQIEASNSAVEAQAPVAKNASTCGMGGGGGGCGCGGGSPRPANTNTAPVAVENSSADSQDAVQVVNTTYTDAKYLDPGVIKVKAGSKVRLVIDVKDSGSGCGSQITIPGLYDSRESLIAGTVINMEFTPSAPGTFPITCGMNMINFGSITVE